jgi:anti-anti-sigma factor
VTRRALIVANGTFRDPGITHLASSISDATMFSELLQRDDVGGFDVTMCLDPGATEARRQAQIFLNTAEYGDLTVILISTHGIKDRTGRLYFATADTELAALNATSLEARFVMERMDECAASKQVLLLDSCFSGAFGKGYVVTKSAGNAVTRDDFGNDDTVGKAVITASNAIQLAAEICNDGRAQSIFTRHVVSGIESGNADFRQSGQILLGELFDYVKREMKKDAPHQTPQPFYYGIDGSTVVALNPARGRMLTSEANGTAPRTTFGIGDVLKYRVVRDILTLHVGASDKDHLADVGIFVEDFLASESATQRARHTASWIANELLDNAFVYCPLKDDDELQLRVQATRDGILVSVSQPDDSAFDLRSILSDPAKSDSFMQLMDRRGLRWHADRADTRLNIGVLLPERLLGNRDEHSHGMALPHIETIETDLRNCLASTLATEADPIVFKFSGRVDESTWESFLNSLRIAVENAPVGIRVLEVDLGDIDYFSSRGLRALTMAKRTADARGVLMTLANPNERVSEILAISRYNRLFEIRNDSWKTL